MARKHKRLREEMEETEVDELVETIEVLATEIQKLNFTLDGLKEDTERMEETQPFLQRQISLNQRKMIKMSNILIVKTNTKKDLDAKLGAYQVEIQAKQKEQLEKDNKTNIKDWWKVDEKTEEAR